MQLIDNASSAHKLWSLRLATASGVAGAIEVAQQVVPALQGAVPDNVFAILSAGLAFAAAIARVFKQKNV